MLSIYGEAEQVKQARLAREEAERQRQEQERKREERRQRYNEEVDRTLALVNCASDYEIACRIRSYVSAMEKAHADQDLSAWASWARAKRIGTTLQSQKRTNFWASENTKRVKRAKGLSTRDTGGKAKVCAPSNLDRIVADLSIPVNNYLNYNLNNC